MEQYRSDELLTVIALMWVSAMSIFFQVYVTKMLEIL
jgi:hypothetical protein